MSQLDRVLLYCPCYHNLAPNRIICSSLRGLCYCRCINAQDKRGYARLGFSACLRVGVNEVIRSKLSLKMSRICLYGYCIVKTGSSVALRCFALLGIRPLFIFCAVGSSVRVGIWLDPTVAISYTQCEPISIGSERVSVHPRHSHL